MGTDLEKIARSTELDVATANQLAELEAKLEHQIDARKEDWFYFALAIIALLDVGAIAAVNSFLLVIPFMFELWFLSWLATRLGVETIVTKVAWLESTLFKAIESWSKKPGA